MSNEALSIGQHSFFLMDGWSGRNLVNVWYFFINTCNPTQFCLKAKLVNETGTVYWAQVKFPIAVILFKLRKAECEKQQCKDLFANPILFLKALLESVHNKVCSWPYNVCDNSLVACRISLTLVKKRWSAFRIRSRAASLAWPLIMWYRLE